jgi:putative hydrolase of the HAD superfamily
VPEPIAVVFDLDDTLYPLEHFVLSGFQAVASSVAAAGTVASGQAFAILRQAYRTERGRELQALLRHLAWPDDRIPALVEVIRTHGPEIRLPELSLAVLRALRPRWRLGIVTNGRPDIQARKVEALGLRRLVDAVVYADEIPPGRGKPDPAPFLEVGRRLDVPPAATVFVGDHVVADVAGAHAVGMRTVWLTTGVGVARPDAADAVVTSLADVPALAERLVAPDWRAHVA